MTLIEKLIEAVHASIKHLDKQEAVSEAHFEEMRRAFKPVLSEDNPHRQIKTTGQC
jgi:hypothetical protein